MSRIFVVGTGVCKSTTEHLAKPEFRKATQNMILAQASLAEAFRPLNNWVADNGTESVGLVLGTGQGELDVTVVFLQTLADSGMARPILFQNSLHNSTSGFLALNQRLTGPLLTVSNLFFSGEDALTSGRLLLQQGQCHFCLVTGVETQVARVMPDGDKPNLSGVVWGDGAATILLCDEWGLEAANLSPLAELLDVRIDRKSRSVARPTECYESDAIELWVRALGETSSHGLSPRTLHLPKPDGSRSEIEWRR